MMAGGSAQRPQTFVELWVDGFFRSDPDFLAKALVEEWSGFDSIPHGDFAEILFALRQLEVDLRAAPSDEDRAFFDALPDPVTIYRGQDASAAPGLSWTTDREVATKLAGPMRSRHLRNPVILEAKITKADIAFVCNDRQKAELVLWAAPRVKRRLPLPSVG